MKKNVIAIVAAVALVLLAVPTIAFANGMQQTWCPSGGAGSLAHHAMRAAGDSNGTGGQGSCAGYVDADGDGVCDNYGAGQGSRSGYVDADGDGICDNYGNGYGCGNGQGNGNGYGPGNGNGAGYVDADNDGVCDNYGAGNGRGHHGMRR